MLGEDFWEEKVMRKCFLSYLTFFLFSRIILKALAKELRFLKRGPFFPVLVPSFYRTLVWNPNCCSEWEHRDQQDRKISFRVRRNIFNLFLFDIFSQFSSLFTSQSLLVSVQRGPLGQLPRWVRLPGVQVSDLGQRQFLKYHLWTVVPIPIFSVGPLLPANEIVNMSKKTDYNGYRSFQVLPKVNL